MCVCPYCRVVKNVFVVPKVRWAPLLLLLLLLLLFFLLPFFLTPLSILCAIVPWSWPQSLLLRPRLPPGQLALTPPDQMLPAGAWLRGKVSRKL